MRKLLSLLIIFCLAISTATAAEFSSGNAYGWLASKVASDGSINDVSTTLWAVLAFDKAASSANAEKSLEWIFSQQSNGYCFPVPCKVKDTAMAMIAMNKLQRMDNMSYIQDALASMVIPSSMSGSWAIEVSTAGTGACKLSWEANNQTRDRTVAVDKGRFTECSNSYFLDIESCVGNTILRHPGTKVSVDCTSITGEKTITLVYRASNKYFIVSSTTGDKADVTVNNGCFGASGADSTCRKEHSLYAAWAIKETGATGIDTKLYLLDAYSDASVEDNALLYLATGDSRYLAALRPLQKTDGSFDRSVMKTSLAILALKDDATAAEIVTKATAWLKKAQRTDGSLGDAAETAAALYAAFNEPVEAPPNDYVPPENIICNDDGVCDDVRGEDSENCPDDCPAEGLDDETAAVECNDDGVCDSGDGETAENCDADCICGDGVCDDSETSDSCSDDCVAAVADDTGEDQPVTEEGSSATTWIITILIVLIVIAGGIFGMKKLGLAKTKQKPNTPGGYSFPRPGGLPPMASSRTPPAKQAPMKQMQRPYVPSSKGKDEELEKSLAEARKLLQK